VQATTRRPRIEQPGLITQHGEVGDGLPPSASITDRVVTDVIMEVIAEQDIGTFWRVRRADGTTHLVQVYTLSPWNPPPQGGEYTTEEELEALQRKIDIDV
jgi:hypothetical protein